MGGFDPLLQGSEEPLVKYHSLLIRFLTLIPLTGQGTVLAGQFYWGGILPKSNGGLRRFPQPGWQSGYRVHEHKEALL